MKNLIIVESPAKARTISKFLGKDYTVKASMGHIRDLPKKRTGVDVDNGFEVTYQTDPNKKKIIEELRKAAMQAETVWLATDEDREGEAIAWHLSEVLDLKESKTYRIVFHEITKDAINQAMKTPRPINKELVQAQQARRILDRLVGFELSPLLWKKVKPALSAGRVQSVAVRMIVEREQEINKFKPQAQYRIIAEFRFSEKDNETIIQAELSKRLKSKKKAEEFLQNCKGANYEIADLEKKKAKKKPAPPFTTSTLQQEANRKLGYSVSRTMLLAQQLYESGHITYMRTDSVNLSKQAIAIAKKTISELYGDKYSQPRNFTVKAKMAQEAHEAIRPTNLNKQKVGADASQQRLYELIWKRSIASQMKDAELERTTAKIGISTMPKEFLDAKGEVITFDGFLKVYSESYDDQKANGSEKILPPMKVGDKLALIIMKAIQRFTQPPYRFSEASLVKRMEELGIGRPSTYAPTISTIQKREYVEKKNVPGEMRKYSIIELKNDQINETEKTEKYGAEKGKLIPTDIGVIVNDFLMKYFDNIVDYNFTARVEDEFDEIAEGKKDKKNMLKNFYVPFHNKVEHTLQYSEKFSGARLLGIDPKTGKNVYAKIAKFGPVIQIGEADDKEKPKFASLTKKYSLDSITLEEALKLFKFPYVAGTYEGSDLVINTGRYGPYVLHKDSFYSIPKGEDPLEISQERAIQIIEEKRKVQKEKVINKFGNELAVLNGRWGPYISYKKKNYKIPKDVDPKSLTEKECMELIDKSKAKKGRKKK
jgi:DNA topoisomerase-1